MKNKIELFLLFLLIPVDFIMAILGALFAYYLRFSIFFQNIRPAIFKIDFKSYVYSTLLIALFLLLVLALNGLYDKRQRPFYKVVAGIFFSTSTTFLLFLLYLFIIKQQFESRFIILFAWLAITIFLILGRLWVKQLKNILYKKGIALKNIVLVGLGNNCSLMLDYFNKNKINLGYNVVAQIDDFENLDKIFDDLLEKYPNIEEIWQCDPSLSRQISVKLIDLAIKHHLIFKYTSGGFESRVTNIDVFVYNGIPFVELKRTPLEGWGKIVKRLVDIIGASVGIILFSPIMIITAIAIKLDSPGPILADIPERAGQFGKPFKFLKFRSMYVGAHKDQAKLKSDRPGLFKKADDPRVTRVGKFIRKWSIDELPQFFNVLLGDMSLVGPRPHFPYEYKEEHKRVLMIKPGITGMGQISGRSDLSFDEEVKLDLYYIEHWSIWLDFWIILKTPLAVFRKRKAS